MDYFPPALENLVEQFAKLPGVGRKSAQRLAFFILDQPDDEAKAFADAIVSAKTAISCCPVCQNLTEGDGPCPMCASSRRDHTVICVVADPKDVIAMERGREYHGLYHVLHGVISPMNHVGPDDLRIKQLLEVTKLTPEELAEVHLMLDKAQEIYDQVKKDGSWGVHAPRYLLDRVTSGAAYIVRAQAIVDNGGYQTAADKRAAEKKAAK